MTRYRNRTPNLIGPWRASRVDADRDAVVAAQARFDPSRGDRLQWEVRGEIEAQPAAA